MGCANSKPEEVGDWQEVPWQETALEPAGGGIAVVGIEGDEAVRADRRGLLNGRSDSVRVAVPPPPGAPSVIEEEVEDVVAVGSAKKEEEDDWGETTRLGVSPSHSFTESDDSTLNGRSASYMIATSKNGNKITSTADGSSEAIAEEGRVSTPTPSDIGADEEMAFVLQTGAMVRRPTQRRSKSQSPEVTTAAASDAEIAKLTAQLTDITGAELNMSTSSRSSRLNTSGSSAASPGLNTSTTSKGSNTSVRRGTYWGTYTPEEAHEKRALKATASTASIDEMMLQELVEATEMVAESPHKPLYTKESLGLTRGTPDDREKHAARLRLIEHEEAAKKLERRKSLKAHNKKLKKIQSTSNQEQLSARRKREEQHRKRQEFLASAKAGKPSPQMRRKAAMARPKKNLPASYGNVGEYLDEARAQASPKTARKHPFINTSNQTSRV